MQNARRFRVGNDKVVRPGMHRVLILGAGKIGPLISGLFAESGSYTVFLGDVDGPRAAFCGAIPTSGL